MNDDSSVFKKMCQEENHGVHRTQYIMENGERNMTDLDEFLAECRECKRAIAVKMDQLGYTSASIEELLHVSGSFVRKWRVRYHKEGIDSLYLQYRGSQGFLSSEEHAEVIAFLETQESYGLDELRDYLEATYDVVYQSKQSYYNLFHEAHISWKKTEKTHPDHNTEKVLARREELRCLLESRRDEIESGELVVWLEDECHLLWGDTLGYVWGRRNTPITVSIKNEKARQTYYGALNFATRQFHVCPFPKGNSVYTVQFVKYLQSLAPDAKLLLIWDGARYHQYAEMKAYLHELNDGRDKKDWLVTCELFAPNAPEQNPVEDIWLKGKNFLRKYFYKHKTFTQVKRAFLDFLHTTIFHFPKLDWYAYQ
jgi:putative transposase